MTDSPTNASDPSACCAHGSVAAAVSFGHARVGAAAAAVARGAGEGAALFAHEGAQIAAASIAHVDVEAAAVAFAREASDAAVASAERRAGQGSDARYVSARRGAHFLALLAEVKAEDIPSATRTY